MKIYSLNFLKMPDEIKEKLITEYYFPYRTQIERKIEQHLQHNRQVIHLSFHSFTPVLNGETRKRKSEFYLIRQVR